MKVQSSECRVQSASTQPAEEGALPSVLCTLHSALGRGPWAVWVDGAAPGWRNMALDQAMLDLAETTGQAFARLYRWDPFCLSFGRHEPALERYDRARIQALGLDCVRRPTGGRAVWHARELTYAVAAPIAGFGSLRSAFETIHTLLAGAVRRLGARPSLAPRATRAARPAAGPCFALAGAGELVVAGRKVLGSAQLRQGAAFLQHGSLLLEDDQALVHSLAGEDPATEAQSASLSDLLGRRICFREAAEAVLEAVEPFAEERGGRREELGTRGWRSLAPHSWLLVPLQEAAARHEPRFRSAEWTWSR